MKSHTQRTMKWRQNTADNANFGYLPQASMVRSTYLCLDILLISAYIIILHNSLFICSSMRHVRNYWDDILCLILFIFIFYFLSVCCSFHPVQLWLAEVSRRVWWDLQQPVTLQICSHLIMPSLSIITTSICSFCIYIYIYIWFLA